MIYSGLYDFGLHNTYVYPENITEFISKPIELKFNVDKLI